MTGDESDRLLRMLGAPAGNTSAPSGAAPGGGSGTRELDDDVHQRIQELAAQGDDRTEDDDFEGARQAYASALTLLREPGDQWSAWTWLQSAVGDTYFFEGRWDECRRVFRMALAGPDGLGNPFIHLRLGQCAVELNDEAAAKDELMRAYMGGGTDIFEDDRKYLLFLEATVDLSRPKPH